MDFFSRGKFWQWGQQAELARRAGISRQYLSDILNCRKRALPELARELEAAAKSMGLSIDKVYFMYPQDGPERIFTTKAVKARRRQELKAGPQLLEHNELMTMLITGRGRLPAKKVKSKRTLQMIDDIARRMVYLEEARLKEIVVEVYEEKTREMNEPKLPSDKRTKIII
jgi:transcriptional regulator with XRE-family HTH domain